MKAPNFQELVHALRGHHLNYVTGTKKPYYCQGCKCMHDAGGAKVTVTSQAHLGQYRHSNYCPSSLGVLDTRHVLTDHEEAKLLFSLSVKSGSLNNKTGNAFQGWMAQGDVLMRVTVEAGTKLNYACPVYYVVDASKVAVDEAILVKGVEIAKAGNTMLVFRHQCELTECEPTGARQVFPSLWRVLRAMKNYSGLVKTI